MSARSASTAQDIDVADMEDPQLVSLMASGNTLALETLYGRYSRIVFSFALRIVGDPATAEELLQEVFFRAWQQAQRFSEGKGTFVTWLLSITHNMAIDEIRKRQRRPQRADSADPDLMLANVTDKGPSVEDHAVISSWRGQITDALQQLPVAQREAIEMAYFQGLTQREISESLGEPLGTIKTRM
ncbi:MAG: RNA polymerase sigma factor, partial [Thermomicrobiales bacterium]